MAERIAHAMGCLQGIKYTNSEQAFRQSYDLGRRMFEVDVELFADNLLVPFHNKEVDKPGWRLGLSSDQVDSSAALSYSFHLPDGGSVTALSMEELFDIISRYSDCRFIIDIKGVSRQISGWRKWLSEILVAVPAALRMGAYQYLYKNEMWMVDGLEANLAFRNLINDLPEDVRSRMYIQANLDNYFIFHQSGANFVWRKKRKKWLRIDPSDASRLGIRYYSVYMRDLKPRLIASCAERQVEICVYGHKPEDEEELLGRGFHVFSDKE